MYCSPNRALCSILPVHSCKKNISRQSFQRTYCKHRNLYFTNDMTVSFNGKLVMTFPGPLSNLDQFSSFPSFSNVKWYYCAEETELILPRHLHSFATSEQMGTKSNTFVFCSASFSLTSAEVLILSLGREFNLAWSVAKKQVKN